MFPSALQDTLSVTKNTFAAFRYSVIDRAMEYCLGHFKSLLGVLKMALSLCSNYAQFQT
jgi:hypothetical protein